MVVDEMHNAQMEPKGSNPGETFNINSMRLKLDQFEGPFEVLLYLIKEQEIDIFNIPIVQVTRQYLEFLDLLREEHLDIAGDFLVMAATLIQIKSRMLLPVDVEQEEEEIEEEDPRLELVEKLLEYRKYRDLAQLLGQREKEWMERFGRRVKLALEPEDDEEEEFLEVSLYDLLGATRNMRRFLMGDTTHNVQLESASVDEKIAAIENILEIQESVSWSELCEAKRSKLEMVCCLLAILELCRMQRVRVRQHHPFGELRIFLCNSEKSHPLEDFHEPDLFFS